MGIGVGTEGYEIWLVEIACPHSSGKCESNGRLMLDKPDNKQTKVRNDTQTLSKDVGTFNIGYDIMGLILV